MENQGCRRKTIMLAGIVLLFIIAACEPVSPATTDEAPDVTLTTEAPAMTATQAPAATTALPTVILAYSNDADSLAVNQTRSALEVLAEESGFALVSSDQLLPEMLTSNVRVVVGIGPGLSLNSLSGSAPDISFVAVDNPDAASTDNLFVIGDPSIQQERQAFMAGYLAAVLSTDYKVGGLFSPDAGDEIVNAFVIGAEFFCGICNPSYPPYNNFPYWDYLSAERDGNRYQSIVDELVSYGVEILYLQGSLVSAELLSYLSDVGIKVVSDSKPDVGRNNWVGTVQSDPGAALSNIWEDVVLGSGSGVIPASITLTEMDAALVSEGRLRLFEEMVADLDAGLVSTQYVP